MTRTNCVGCNRWRAKARFQGASMKPSGYACYCLRGVFDSPLSLGEWDGHSRIAPHERCPGEWGATRARGMERR